jgi:predicted neuraminidase
MKSKIIFILFIWSLVLAAQDNIFKQSGYIKSEFVFSIDKKPTPQCHASTIISTSEGLVVAWFGGTREENPDVGIWISRELKGVWTEPVEVVNGKQEGGKRYPCWNPVLFQPKSFPLILFYKVGPNPRAWWSMMTTSIDNGKTWSKPEKLPENIFGPIKNKPVQLSTGEIISPSSTENDGWKVHIEKSCDDGKTWKRISPLNDGKTFSAIQPTVLIHNKNVLQILCRSRQSVILESWSKDNGETWSELSKTNLVNPNSGIDAVTLKDGRHLLVYNNVGMKDENTNGPRTPLCVAISKDGEVWNKALTLENNPGEYSYPAVIQTNDGLVHISYTYNRESIKHVIIDPEVIN